MQIDFHDLRMNGSPALLRALAQIETALKKLDAAQAQQEEAIIELQYLWSEEIMRQLFTPPATPPAAGIELAAIEDRPPNTPAATELTYRELDAFLHPGEWG